VDSLVGRLNTLLKQVDKGTKDLASKKTSDTYKRLLMLRVKVSGLIDEIGKSNKLLDERLKSCDTLAAWLEALKKFDIYSPAAMKTGQLTMTGSSIGGLAMNISSIISAV
jgi:hypothetical protein